MIKKYLPFILIGVGLLVVIVTVILVKKSKKAEVVDTEEIVAEIPADKRPVASLTPTKDGHWLTLGITDIKLDAASFDYELLYKLPDGRTQGVPGTVNLDGQTAFERKLLLGSESSGKFRYDEGVETGTLSLKFRNGAGKLVGKLTTEFHMQTKTNVLTSTDNTFQFTLNKTPKEGFFVVMQTFSPVGGYGVFSEVASSVTGKVTSSGNWKEAIAPSSTSLGIFTQ